MTIPIAAFILAFGLPLFFGSWRSVFASLGAQALIVTAIVAGGEGDGSAARAVQLLDLSLLHGLVAPLYLIRVLRRAGAPPQLDVIPGNLVHWLLGLSLTVAASSFAWKVHPDDLGSAIHLGTVATEVLIGIFILANQAAPIGQAIGVLTIESGILLFESRSGHHFPLPVQLGLAGVSVALLLIVGQFLGRFSGARTEAPPTEEAETL